MEIEVLSSFTRKPGTVVKEEVAHMEDIVRGVTVEEEHVKLTMAGVPDKPGMAARLFGRLAAAGINVDMIVQNTSARGLTDISFTLHQDDEGPVRKCCRSNWCGRRRASR